MYIRGVSMKRILIFILLLLLTFFVSVEIYQKLSNGGLIVSDIEELKRDVVIKNYNDGIKERQYNLSMDMVIQNSENIRNYIYDKDVNVDLSFLSELQLSDLTYIKQIYETASSGVDALQNFIFYDSETNELIDYYILSTNVNKVIFEIDYLNGKILNVKIS